MSNAKYEALKALFKKEKAQKEDGGKKPRGDMYPFWQMEVNQKAVVRILPDKNPDNPYMFYTDKLEHTLSINGKDERIPCLSMYGEKCPICDLSRQFYKAEGKESKQGKYYYRKKTALVRVLVVEDPLPKDEDTGETCEGKVMNTQFSFQLMEKIKEEIGSDALEGDIPWDMQEGYNFIIKKTPQGEYGTYSIGSGFARKQTAIDPELAETLELVDLETLLPKNPGHEFVQRKLNSHLNGEDDDDGEGDNATTPPPTKTSKVTKVTESDDGDDDEDATPPPTKTSKVTKVAEPEPDGDDDGGDILEQIRRNRQGK